MAMHAVTRSRVEDDSGVVSVQLDHGVIRYSAGRKHINVQIEHGEGAISVYKGSVRQWFPPFENQPIAEIDREKIVADIAEAMKLLGIECLIE